MVRANMSLKTLSSVRDAMWALEVALFDLMHLEMVGQTGSSIVSLFTHRTKQRVWFYHRFELVQRVGRRPRLNNKLWLR